MIKFKKRFLILTIISILGLNIPTIKVNAITVQEGSFINLSTYGLKPTNTSHYRTSYKTTTSDNEVYCVQFTKNFTPGSYTENNCKDNGTTKKLTETNYIVAGQIISIISAKSDWSTKKKYAYKVAALNEYFRGKLSGSANFDEKALTEIISKAKTQASDYGKNKTKKLTKPKVTGSTSSDVDSNTLIRLNSATKDGKTVYNYRKAIKFTNLDKEFLDATPKYTISGKLLKGSGSASICEDSGTSKCASTKTISGVDSKTLYVRLTNASEDAEVRVTVSTEVTKKYSKAKIYCRGTKNQAVLMNSTSEQKYSTTSYADFEAPDYNNHKLTIRKIDESGENLNGAEFKLYIKGNENSPLTLSKSGNKFIYTTETLANKDDFFDKTYCYKETTTPNGYKIENDQEQCKEIPKKDKAEYCENNETGATVDKEYCNTNIGYMCKVEKIQNVTTIDPTTGESATTSSKVGPEYITTDDCNNTTPETTTGENGETIETYEERTSICSYKNEDGTYKENADEKYCENKGNYTKVTISGGNVTLFVTNTKNNIKISKKAISGTDEIPGAHLKICTDTDYNKNKTECTATKTISDVELSWVSSTTEASFNGLNPGTYYIIETIPPTGYKLLEATTATKFTIDEHGKIKTGNTEVKDNTIVINNELNNLSISKTDIATSKELPGAKMAICTTVTTDIIPTEENEENGETTPDDNTTNNNSTPPPAPTKYDLELDINGDCIPAVLADGTDAIWTSTKEPHTIKGLPAGTYYLVEQVAPTNYSTAESILFTIKEDGKIYDINNKLLSNNKIVMKDKKIKEVKTGDLPIIGVFIICLSCIFTAITCYHYTNKKYGMF